MKEVILCIGKARSGKDTTAKHAMEYLESKGKKCVHMSFAKLLKQQAKRLGWNGEKDEAGRTFLQHLGDVMKEYHGKDYYAGHVLGEILCDLEHDVVFITDCRFKTELSLFTTCPVINTKTIRVTRPGFVSDLTPEQQNHISEIDLDDVKEDILIENTGSEEELFERVEEIFNS